MTDNLTQEELDEEVNKGSFHSAILNEDGSVTYEMSKRQHKKIMEGMADSVEKSMAEMVGSEDYPNFTKVEADNNYTHFTVTTKSTELDLNEQLSIFGFYMWGGMYGIFNGDSNVVITVDYVNADSGEIIKSANSSETEK